MPPAFDRILITLILLSVQAPNLKVGDFQVYEGVALASIPYMVLRFRGFLAGRVAVLFLPLMGFLLAASLILYFSIDFFPPPGIGPLKAPLAISFVRLMQLSLIVVVFNYMWLVLKESRSALWAMRRYVDISLLIAVPTIVSFLAAQATGFLTPLVYDTAYYLAEAEGGLGMARARGLFNEGGPYGLSLVASLVLALLLRTGGGGAPLLRVPVLVVALFLSQSKAALLCAALMLTAYTLSRMSLRKLAVFAAVVAVSGTVLVYFSQFFLSGFMGYYKSVEQVAGNAAVINSTDGDLAYGRMAAFFIAPRMIADNAVLGVGLGNYSLVRNNPKYLGNFPEVTGWDLSGLGIFTLLAEGGVIGFILLPLGYYLFYRGSGPAARGYGYLFLTPLLLQTFGVQMYFAYHWMTLLLLAAFLEWRGTERELSGVKAAT